MVVKRKKKVHHNENFIIRMLRLILTKINATQIFVTAITLYFGYLTLRFQSTQEKTMAGQDTIQAVQDTIRMKQDTNALRTSNWKARVDSFYIITNKNLTNLTERTTKLEDKVDFLIELLKPRRPKNESSYND